MQLTVKTINAEKHVINFNDSTTVMAIKQEVAKKYDNMEPVNLVLVSAGSPLDKENATLVSLGIENKATLHLVFRLRGGLP